MGVLVEPDRRAAVAPRRGRARSGRLPHERCHPGGMVAHREAPLAVGFVAQAVIGSWTNLMPAIGPGDASAHRGLARRGRGSHQSAGSPKSALVALVALGATTATP